MTYQYTPDHFRQDHKLLIDHFGHAEPIPATVVDGESFRHARVAIGGTLQPPTLWISRRFFTRSGWHGVRYEEKISHLSLGTDGNLEVRQQEWGSVALPTGKTPPERAVDSAPIDGAAANLVARNISRVLARAVGK